jgi:hypothetical protein
MTVLPEIRRELIATATRNADRGRRSWSSQWRRRAANSRGAILALAAAVAVVIAVCVIVVASSGGPRSSMRSGANTRPQQQVRAINATRYRPIAASLLAHYALFRSYPTYSPTRHPDLPTPGISGGYTGEMHLNYWQTRFIATLTGLDGRGIWVTPGTRGLCISDPKSTSCAMLDSKRDRAGFIGGITTAKRQQTIAGVVPDGNSTVTLVLSDGRQTNTPVMHNVYEATVRGKVTAVIDRNSTGQIVRRPLS